MICAHHSYGRLGLPLQANDFVEGLRVELADALRARDDGMPRNPDVRLDPRRRHPIIVSPLDPQPEPPGLAAIKEGRPGAGRTSRRASNRTSSRAAWKRRARRRRRVRPASADDAAPRVRKLTIHDAPASSRFKGYASFLVQDLVLRPHVVQLLRECWRTPDGKTVTAPLPPGVEGHFGPELRRFVLALYHQGQVTVGRLVTLLRGIGVLISKRQVVRLLIAGKQSLDKARACCGRA